MRTWLLGVLCGFGLVAAGWLAPVVAQGTDWAAWLFDPAAGRMIYVTGASGAVDAVSLSLPAADYTTGRVAVGHGGSPFAYIASNAEGVARLVVADRAQIRFQYELPSSYADSLEFSAGSAPFTADDSAFALGYSLVQPGWEIIVMDIRTGAIPYTLRSSDPLAVNNRLDSRFGVTPVIREFNGDRVMFTLVLAGTEGAAQYQSFTWHLGSDQLIANDVYPALDAARLPATGEVIMALPDERLPAAPESFPFFQANTLHVFNPANGARYPFFYVTDLNLYRPRFIQNGEWILVGGEMTTGEAIWMVIGRDGQLAGTLPSTVTIDHLWGLGDGFLYTTGGFSPGAVTLVYAYTRPGLNAGAPVYISDAGQTLDIAWAGNTVAIPPPAAYTAWAQLADPVYVLDAAPLVIPALPTAPSVLLVQPTLTTPPLLVPSLAPVSSFTNQPTPSSLLLAPSLTPPPVPPDQVVIATPVFGAVLRIGGLATVQTTQGDKLNMRLSPDLSAPVLAQLETGTHVTVVDGPRTANGFTWWKIRAANGLEGWAVESVDDDGIRLQTLLPY
jgi:hypothetical protein